MNCSTRHFMTLGALYLLIVIVCDTSGCKSSLDESSEGFALANVTTLEVPDSSKADSIRVHLVGTVGPNTSYSMDHIDSARNDSLFSIAIWAKWKEIYGQEYPSMPPPFDTTLIFQSSLRGIHYVDVHSSTSDLRDSTIVY